MSRLRTSVKDLVERAFGIKIYRAPHDKHFYADLAGLRPWTPQDVVFDVGANDGRIVQRLQQHLPSPRIYAFEPVKATFHELVRRTEHLDNVRCLQLAMGDRPGEATMYLHDLAVMNSLSPDWGSPIGTETVQVSTVDQVMQQEGIDVVHFLKIDTEGHELQVLEGAREALRSSRIDIIQAEVGFDQAGRGGATLEDVRRFLAPMGYLLYGLYNQSRTWVSADEPARTILAYGDAVFVTTR